MINALSDAEISEIEAEINQYGAMTTDQIYQNEEAQTISDKSLKLLTPSVRSISLDRLIIVSGSTYSPLTTALYVL